MASSTPYINPNTSFQHSVPSFSSYEMQPRTGESNSLYRISNPSEFDKWMKAFVKVLRENNLKHLIPAKFKLVVTSNMKEIDYMEKIFNTFVPVDAYPKWFREELENDYLSLEEELYIRSLPHMNAKGKVLKLNKSLYDLKQSGAYWYRKMRSY